MKTNLYYFNYVVTGSIETTYSNFKDAIKHAEAEGELVYLTIYHKLNAYNEPYSDLEVNRNTNLKEVKQELIKQFNKLVF